MDPFINENQSTDLLRVAKLYKAKHKSFGSKQGLADWYDTQLKKQNHCCYYCNTPIALIQKLIANKILKTRATKGGGYRGEHLEIDKQGNEYSPETCVLACYYCNNDKSYIFSKEDIAIYGACQICVF